jgi:hypothetical protein
VNQNRSKKILSTTIYVELLRAQQINKHFANLLETHGVNNLSKKLRKIRPLLKNVLLSTFKFKNGLGCSRRQLMCHQSYYRPVTNGTLGKDIEKNSKMPSRCISNSLEPSNGLENTQRMSVFFVYLP